RATPARTMPQRPPPTMTCSQSSKAGCTRRPYATGRSPAMTRNSARRSRDNEGEAAAADCSSRRTASFQFDHKHLLKACRRPVSEFVGDTGLLHDRIGGVAGQNLGVDRKVAIGDRAEPDFVIALAGPHRAAAMLTKDTLHLRGEAAHSAAWTSSRRSATTR